VWSLCISRQTVAALLSMSRARKSGLVRGICRARPFDRGRRRNCKYRSAGRTGRHSGTVRGACTSGAKPVNSGAPVSASQGIGRVARTRVIDHVGEAEVGDLHDPFTRDHDIGGLTSLWQRIPQTCACSMPWQNWIAHLSDCTRSGERAPQVPSSEFNPSSVGLDILHPDVDAPRKLFDEIRPDHVRMAFQITHDLRFLAELVARLFVAKVLVRSVLSALDAFSCRANTRGGPR